MTRSVTVTYADNTREAFVGIPDDVSPEQIKAKAERSGKRVIQIDGGGAPSTRAEAKAQGKPRSTLEQAKHWGGLAGRTALGGVADLVDTASSLNPINAIRSSAAMVAGLYDPKIADAIRPNVPNVAEFADRVSDDVGLGKAETPTEELASALGRGAIGAAVPAGVAGGLARVGVKAAAPFAAKAGTQILSGALSSGAGEAARQLGAPEPVQFAASLVGGGAPALYHGAKGGLGHIGEFRGKEGTRIRTARELQAGATDAKAAAARLEALKASRSGAMPTLGEAAGDQGLAAMTRHELASSDALANRIDKNAQVRADVADAQFGTGDVENVPALGSRVARREQFNREVEQLKAQQAHEDTIEAQREARAKAIEQGREDISPVADREAIGTGWRKQLTSGYDAIKAKVAKLYENPILQTEHRVRVAPDLHAELTDLAHKYYGNAAGDPPKGLQEITGDLLDWTTKGRKGEVITNSSVVTNIDRRLADFAGEAKMSGRRAEARLAQKMRGILDKNTAKSIPDDFKATYAEAKAARREQGIKYENVRNNPIAKAMAPEAFGTDKVSDLRFPGQLVKKGEAGGDAANALIRAVGEDASEPFVRKTVRALIEEGELTSKNIKHFQHLLKRFPKIEAHVNNLKEIEDFHVIDKLRQIPIGKDEFGPTALGRVTEPGSGSRMISNMIETDKGVRFKELVGQVRKEGDPEALAGIKRGLAEYIKDAGGKAKLDAAGNPIPNTNRSLEAIDTVLQHSGDLLDDAQRTALKAIQKEMERANFAGHAGTYAGRTTGFDPNLPLTTGITARTARWVMKHFGNQKDVDNLIHELMLNPKEAAEFLKRPTPDRLEHFKRIARPVALGTVYGSNPQPAP